MPSGPPGCCLGQVVLLGYHRGARFSSTGSSLTSAELEQASERLPEARAAAFDPWLSPGMAGDMGVRSCAQRTRGGWGAVAVPEWQCG